MSITWIHLIHNQKMYKQINKYDDFWMCILFYFSFIRLHVCAFAIHSMVHCGSAFVLGAFGLPYYCTPPVCVPDVLGTLAVWRQNKTKQSCVYSELDLESQVSNWALQCPGWSTKNPPARAFACLHKHTCSCLRKNVSWTSELTNACVFLRLHACYTHSDM